MQKAARVQEVSVDAAAVPLRQRGEVELMQNLGGAWVLLRSADREGGSKLARSNEHHHTTAARTDGLHARGARRRRRMRRRRRRRRRRGKYGL